MPMLGLIELIGHIWRFYRDFTGIPCTKAEHSMSESLTLWRFLFRSALYIVP